MGFVDALLNRVNLGLDIYTEADFVGGLTLEAMVNFNTLDDAHQEVISIEGRLNLGVALTTDLPYMFIYPGAGNPWIYGDFAVSTGRWYHIVGTWDGTMRLIVNGIQQASTLAVGVPNIDPVNRINAVGAHYTGGVRNVDGRIAFVRIYDCPLTLGEARWNRLNYHNPVRPGNLLLWLPMEEGSGLTVVDHSGLGHNGDMLPVLTPPTWERVKQYELRSETE